MWLCEDKLKGKTAHFRLPSVSQKHACLSSLFCFRPRTPTTKDRQQKRSSIAAAKARGSASRILQRAINTQHKNFYYLYMYLYACKTVVFIIIYSSIELTFGFDRNDRLPIHVNVCSVFVDPDTELSLFFFLGVRFSKQ